MKEYSDPVGEKMQSINEMRVSVGLLNFGGYPQFVVLMNFLLMPRPPFSFLMNV